jgi:hypothetical protein
MKNPIKVYLITVLLAIVIILAIVFSYLYYKTDVSYLYHSFVENV